MASSDLKADGNGLHGCTGFSGAGIGCAGIGREVALDWRAIRRRWPIAETRGRRFRSWLTGQGLEPSLPLLSHAMNNAVVYVLAAYDVSIVLCNDDGCWQ